MAIISPLLHAGFRLALLWSLLLLGGCARDTPDDDGPKPGELRTTTGKPAPPEAANASSAYEGLSMRKGAKPK